MAQNDHPCLSDLWTLKTIGIYDPVQVKEDDKALEKFNTICYRKGRYCVSLPWKSDYVQFPENFGRMKSLSRRLQADRTLLQQYCEVIQSWN